MGGDGAKYHNDRQCGLDRQRHQRGQHQHLQLRRPDPLPQPALRRRLRPQRLRPLVLLCRRLRARRPPSIRSPAQPAVHPAYLPQQQLSSMFSTPTPRPSPTASSCAPRPATTRLPRPATRPSTRAMRTPRPTWSTSSTPTSSTPATSCSSFNNFGDLSQNVTLPGADFFAHLFSSGESTVSMNSSVYQVANANDVNFTGSTTADATTGDNIASSTDDIGSTTPDTSPLSPASTTPLGAGVVTTGNAYSSANTLTQANTNHVGGTSVFILFRVAGSWTGHVVGLPTGLTENVIPDGNDNLVEILSDDATTTAQAADWLAKYNSSKFLAAATSTANVVNNVDVSADTGNNTATTRRRHVVGRYGQRIRFRQRLQPHQHQHRRAELDIRGLQRLRQHERRHRLWRRAGAYRGRQCGAEPRRARRASHVHLHGRQHWQCRRQQRRSQHHLRQLAPRLFGQRHHRHADPHRRGVEHRPRAQG